LQDHRKVRVSRETRFALDAAAPARLCAAGTPLHHAHVEGITQTALSTRELRQ